MITMWYVAANMFEPLQLSIEYMRQYQSISQIYILHCDNNKPSHFGYFQSLYPNITEEYKYFGKVNQGEDYLAQRQNPDSWLANEADCRSYAIKQASKLGNGWLLQCDADEFFINLGELLHLLNDADHFFLFPRYNFYAVNAFIKNTVINYGVSGGLIRLWHTSSGTEYRFFVNKRNSPSIYSECLVRKLVTLKDFCAIIHIREMVAGRRQDYITKGWTILETKFDWPQSYMEYFQKHKTNYVGAGF